MKLEEERGNQEDGPDFQTLNIVKEDSELGKLFLEGAEELGYPIVDINKMYYNAGFDHFYQNKRKGRRSGVFQELFGKPQNSNLVIKRFSTVEKILLRKIEETRKFEAFGVEFVQFGKNRKVFAQYEIVISAGAIESPKLLLLSDIGPAKHLKELKIPVKKDLPVGENLQNHVFTPLSPHVINRSLSILQNSAFNPTSLFNYLIHGEGPLSKTGYLSTGFIYTTNNSSWPNVQLVLVGLSANEPDLVKVVKDRCNIKDGILKSYFASSIGKDVYSFSIAPVLVRPKSRGRLRLDPYNPKGQLLIDPKYLEHPEDFEALVEGIKIAEKLSNTQALKSIGSGSVKRLPLKLCEHHPLGSFEYGKCHVKTLTVSGAHACGTCAMGSVLDSELRVLGVKGLRVADASIFPVIPNANIYWPCLMVGKRAAELIVTSIQNQKILATN